MEKKFSKIKVWISSSFQFITLGLLVFTVVIILKQQYDIHLLKSDIQVLNGQIDDVHYKVKETDNNVDEVKTKLENVDYHLSNEIDDVKRLIRWID